MSRSILSNSTTKSRVVVVVGLLAICLIIWGAWASQHLPHINISRAQYEQALSKWKALNIQEYEISNDIQAFLGGIYSVRVTENG